jgi:hypothetical protein
MVFSDQIEMRIKVKQENNTMHALKMLHQNLKKSCPQIHACRLTALMDVVTALAQGQTLTVTALGRSSPRAISMKHGIKQSDRLIGNAHLHEERGAIYQAIAHRLLAGKQRPLILIDWSDYTYDRSTLLLRASVPVGGRALTLYEEVHPVPAYGKACIQKRFLQTLHALLPAKCRPIIITDAGFAGSWFRAVQRLGWDYIGRITQNLLYRDTPERPWIKCVTLHEQSTATPRYVGEVELVRSHPFRCHLYRYKHRARGRHQWTQQGLRARSQHSKKNALREQLPWLLVTSLPHAHGAARQIIQLYRTRMQIEEAFRDIKNQRTGFSLTDTRTRSPQRLANLLLIGMLATLVVWMLGRLAEEKQLHYQYQANTVKTQRVLSLFYLGCLLILQGQAQFTQRECLHAIKLIQSDMLKQWES